LALINLIFFSLGMVKNKKLIYQLEISGLNTVFNIEILGLVTASKNEKKTLKCRVLIVKISSFVPCDPKQGITVLLKTFYSSSS